MRLLLIALLVFSYALAQTQITITTNHLPDAGDTLKTRNAIFSNDVNIEETGENFVWNFGFDVLEPLVLNPEIICYDVNETPLVYQFLFNNPFEPEYNSDFGLGVDQASIAAVSFENAYMYYQNSNTKYTITGMGATINGLPLAARMDDPDLLFNLPLTFDSADSSHSELSFDIPQLGYYGLDQTRNYHCDGWGTLNIWGQSFDVLRVRSIINATDSIFTSFINLGISLPRPESITYEWISTEHLEPILKVTTTAGVISQVQVADIYQEKLSVDEKDLNSLLVYPNPTSNMVYIKTPLNAQAHIQIHDAIGKCVLSKWLIGPILEVEIGHLNSGFYTVKTTQNGQIFQSNFIKE